jgi:hypothetical protein
LLLVHQPADPLHRLVEVDHGPLPRQGLEQVEQAEMALAGPSVEVGLQLFGTEGNLQIFHLHQRFEDQQGLVEQGRLKQAKQLLAELPVGGLIELGEVAGALFQLLGRTQLLQTNAHVAVHH